MKKAYILGITLIGLFCAVSFVFAVPSCPTGQVCIPNPLGANNFCELLMGNGTNTGIIGTVGGVVVALGTIMIIIAGILFLTSAGSPERMTTAKKALIYAIIGIAIGISANVIVEIIKGVLNANSTTC